MFTNLFLGYSLFTTCLLNDYAVNLLRVYQISFTSHLPGFSHNYLAVHLRKFTSFFQLRLLSFIMVNLVNAQRWICLAKYSID